MSWRISKWLSEQTEELHVWVLVDSRKQWAELRPLQWSPHQSDSHTYEICSKTAAFCRFCLLYSQDRNLTAASICLNYCGGCWRIWTQARKEKPHHNHPIWLLKDAFWDICFLHSFWKFHSAEGSKTHRLLVLISSNSARFDGVASYLTHKRIV